MNCEYCFLLSVYKNTKLDELKETVYSMENQTVSPRQIVIVRDGVVENELQTYLDDLQKSNCELYTVVSIEKNVGLGEALRVGTDYCKYELIARIDSDDVCVLDRCEKQLRIFENDDTLSVIGSNIKEFVGDIYNVVSSRVVPEKHEDICKYLKKRCPFNHMTVMMKKSELTRAGGYLDWHYDEDSYLWVRMYLAGCKFYNIQENLVFARIDDNTFYRRGGLKYYKSERDLFKFMYKHKIISWLSYQKAKIVRFIVYVLMPNKLRRWAFKKFARGK